MRDNGRCQIPSDSLTQIIYKLKCSKCIKITQSVQTIKETKLNLIIIDISLLSKLMYFIRMRHIYMLLMKQITIEDYSTDFTFMSVFASEVPVFP